MSKQAEQTVSVQHFIAHMQEDTPIHTEVRKTLLSPGDDITLPLYAVVVKVTIGKSEDSK